MNKAFNSQEKLELLVTAFIVVELYSEEYIDLVEFPEEPDEAKKEILEQSLIDEFVAVALEKINIEFTEKEMSDVILIGHAALTTIHNIVKYPKSRHAEENANQCIFGTVPVFKLEDFKC